jgi:hypothetical protein
VRTFFLFGFVGIAIAAMTILTIHGGLRNHVGEMRAR